MAWNKILVTGLVASVAIVGCTVTTSSDVGDAALSVGGTDAGKGTGGASAGGSSAGGAAATGGAKSTGGAATSAGGAGTAGADSGTVVDGDCTKCLKEFCATEYADCGKDKDCGQTSKTNGEFYDIQKCMFDITGDASTPVFTQTDLEGCVGAAATATTTLVSCMRGAEDASVQPCTERCYGAIVPYK